MDVLLRVARYLSRFLDRGCWRCRYCVAFCSGGGGGGGFRGSGREGAGLEVEDSMIS